MNLSPTIVPKSDQLNADDLIAGPRTIKITAVESGSSEQPVAIHYAGDDGRPYKPSKSMRRVLVALWGTDGNAYVGRSITLYRDPNIKWGGEPVGGIRISHASDITEDGVMALTETRGKRKLFRVQPLATTADEPPADNQALADIGDTKARGGTEALKAWWATIPHAAQKALKAKLDGEWKQLAHDADERKT